MPSIYHYTRFETFMSYILPLGCIKTNLLRHMNDPREFLPWSFSAINLPYEEIFKGYYNEKTHIDCQYKFGDTIKDSYQVLCFSGAKEKGWNNEMMWAHYGGLHSGVCLEFDEELLVEAIKEKYPNDLYEIGDVDYFNKSKTPWINWEGDKSYEENIDAVLSSIVKKSTMTKSHFWEKEDERRLVFINHKEPFYIPINKALKVVYLGLRLDKKELLESVFNCLNGKFKVSMLIYEKNKFKRWGVQKKDDGEGIMTCRF